MLPSARQSRQVLPPPPALAMPPNRREPAPAARGRGAPRSDASALSIYCSARRRRSLSSEIRPRAPCPPPDSLWNACLLRDTRTRRRPRSLLIILPSQRGTHTHATRHSSRGNRNATFSHLPSQGAALAIGSARIELVHHDGTPFKPKMTRPRADDRPQWPAEVNPARARGEDIFPPTQI